MNILLLNIHLGEPGKWGGIESHSDILSAELVRRGHKVTAGCWVDGCIRTKTANTAIPARRIRIANSIDMPAILRIARIAAMEKIDLIIANNGIEYWPATIAARFSGARAVLIRHNTDRLGMATCHFANKLADKVVAVSRAVKDSLVRSGVKDGKIEIIYNGVSLERFNPTAIAREEVRKRLGIGTDSIVVGMAGRLDRRKGVYDILHAVGRLIKKHPMLMLLFVGEGAGEHNLRQEAERLLGENVFFTGARNDVERMYSAMDIFAFPSICEEAFGMGIIEAMAMRKPVIGTRIGGIPEIITDGINGIIVPPGDDLAISEAIERCIEDEGFSERIAAEGRRTAELMFSDRTMGDGFEAIFKKGIEKLS